MQVNVQKLSPVLVEFNVSVPADRVKSELDRAYTSVARNARVRGFRPGKAPRKVLVHMFGARIAADVAQRLVDDTFPKAIDEKQLQPVSSPDFEPQKIVESEPFVYKARFEVVPEIEALKYDALEAKRPKVDVTQEMIQAEVDKLREAHSTLEAPDKPRAAQKGDVVSIDFDVQVGGKTIEDAGAKDFQVELGTGNLIAAIDEALTGKKPGEQADAEVEMPETHPHPELKGQKSIFKITLKDLKERVLPEADDEFAKDLGDFDTLAELEKDLKARLEKQLKEQSDNSVAEQLVKDLVARNPDPPAAVAGAAPGAGDRAGGPHAGPSPGSAGPARRGSARPHPERERREGARRAAHGRDRQEGRHPDRRPGARRRLERARRAVREEHRQAAS